MKILLVNDQGQPVSCVEHLERYDAREPSHLFALLNLLETLIANATGTPCGTGPTASLTRSPDLGG